MKKGMSLIEILIALSIIGISAMLAIPSFSELIQSYRLQSVALQLEQDLRFAKYSANQKKMRVSLCIAKDMLHCVDQASNDWRQGWILFLDPHNNFQPIPENILRFREPIHASVAVMSSYNIQHGIQFNSGKKFGRSLGSGLANGYFIICNKNKIAHKLILNIYGRLRKEKLDNGCID